MSKLQITDDGKSFIGKLKKDIKWSIPFIVGVSLVIFLYNSICFELTNEVFSFRNKLTVIDGIPSNPYSQIIDAINKTDLIEAKKIYHENKDNFPNKVQNYIQMFFSLIDRFHYWGLNNEDFANADYFIKNASVQKIVLDGINEPQQHLFMQEIPITVLKALYTDTSFWVQKAGRNGKLLRESSHNFITQFIEKTETVNEYGAMAICIEVEMLFVQRRFHEDFLITITNTIDTYQQKYASQIGVNGTYSNYAIWLEEMKKIVDDYNSFGITIKDFFTWGVADRAAIIVGNIPNCNMKR